MTTEENQRKAFKDWFDREAARGLARQVAAAWPAFPLRRFDRTASEGLEALEFQGRVQRFSDALAACLPEDVPVALDILTRSLPPELPNCEAVTDGWLQWPIGQFIADHGVPFLDASMAAMTALTTRFSSEFAIRPFLIERPAETYKRLYALTSHPNPHVRRWCSEGTRPRLPWGRRLQALSRDPSPSWPILEALKDAPEPYVRKSVANHLNDIAKDHPDLVIARCCAWLKKAPPGRQWIVRHGLRTLIKQGHPEALALLGYAPVEGIKANLRAAPRNPAIGDSIELKATLRHAGSTACRVAVDYVVHFARPSGKTSRRVFKWTTLDLEPGGEVRLAKKHPLRHTTIRTLHSGRHRIELQVNGLRLANCTFDLRP